MTSRDNAPAREQLRRLAWLLDSSIRIPGTRFTIGVDALVGLIPVVGDLVGVLTSTYILVQAARMGVGAGVLARMALNIAIEGLVGLVPVAGDLFDAAWKANQRNVRLLEQCLDGPRPARDPGGVRSRAMWFRRIALSFSLLAVALLAVSGPGVRLELWAFGVGLGLVGAALVVGLAGAALALIGLSVARLRAGSAPRFAFALVLGIVAALVPAEFVRRAKAVPSIHDITTDIEQPPLFVAALPLRAGAPNPPGYAGPHIGELQTIAYPNLKPLVLPAPPAKVLAGAVEVARTLGWEVIGTDPGAGRVEAVATSLWFGFKDDVVVRITPEGSGSRVDVRSKSRVGRSDLGANARRIEQFLTRLREKGYS